MDFVFPEFVGQERLQTLFNRTALSGRMGQAYLFVGPEGVGRTTFAWHLMRGLLPEGSLEVHPDLFSLSRQFNKKTNKYKKQISVVQVRELRDSLGLSSSRKNGYKIIWIEEAHTLSIGAANALLKVLEEPRGKTVFFLRAPSKESVPTTIASRCQVIRFAPLSLLQLKNSDIAKNVDKKRLENGLSLSFGCPGRLIRYLNEDENLLAEESWRKAWIEASDGASVYNEWRMLQAAFQGKKINITTLAKNLLAAFEESTRIIWHTSLARAHPDERQNILRKQMEDRLWEIPHIHTALDRNVQPQLALERLILTTKK